jgi:hypothetical protein
MPSASQIVSKQAIGQQLEESGRGLIEVVSSNSPGGLRKPAKTSVRMAKVPSEFRRKPFPNKHL